MCRSTLFSSEPNDLVGLAAGELCMSIRKFLEPLLTQASRVSVVCLMTRWGRVPALDSVLTSVPASLCTLWLMTIVHSFLPLLKRLQMTGPSIPVPVVTLLISIVLNFPDVNNVCFMWTSRLWCRSVATSVAPVTSLSAAAVAFSVHIFETPLGLMPLWQVA